MIFNTHVFDDFAKIVDECESIDILYNKLNNPFVVEGVKYKYDLDFEDNKIYLDNPDCSGGFPLYFSFGEIREKNNGDEGFYSANIKYANDFEEIYAQYKNEFAPLDPFYKLLAYSYTSDNVSVYITPLTKYRDDWYLPHTNPITCLYIATSKYEVFFEFNFEWEYPKNSEENIEFVLGELMRTN